MSNPTWDEAEDIPSWDEAEDISNAPRSDYPPDLAGASMPRRRGTPFLDEPSQAGLFKTTLEGGATPFIPEGVTEGGVGYVQPFRGYAPPAKPTKADLADEQARIAEQDKAVTPESAKAVNRLFDPLYNAAQKNTGAALMKLDQLVASATDFDRVAMTPAQRWQYDRRRKASVMGQGLIESANEAHPVIDPDSVASKIGEAVGGFFPGIAAGPWAPLVFGLQAAGQEGERIYAEEIANGKSEDEAATTATEKSNLIGLFQGALLKYFPKFAKKFGDKAVDKAVGTAIREGYKAQLKRAVVAQPVHAVEGGAFGAASQIGNNLLEGKPILENVPESAAGMAIIQGVTPKGTTMGQAKTEKEFIEAYRGERERIGAQAARQKIRDKIIENEGEATQDDLDRLEDLRSYKDNSPDKFAAKPEMASELAKLEIKTDKKQILSEEHSKELEDALKSENKEAVFTDLDGGVARRGEGNKVDIDEAQLALNLAELDSPAARSELIKRVVHEEAVHSATPDDVARDFFKNSNFFQKKLANRRYHGTWADQNKPVKPSPDYSNWSPENKARYEQQMQDYNRKLEKYETNAGHEMLRPIVQELEGKSPTETAYFFGQEKDGYRALLAAERAVSSLSKALNRIKNVQGGKPVEQQKGIDTVLDNLQKARKMAEVADPSLAEAPKPEGDQPFSKKPETQDERMNLAKQVMDATGEQMMELGKGGFNQHNIELGLNVRSAVEYDQLVDMRNKVTEEYRAAKQKIEEGNPTREELLNFTRIAMKPQFFNEALAMARMTQDHQVDYVGKNEKGLMEFELVGGGPSDGKRFFARPEASSEEIADQAFRIRKRDYGFETNQDSFGSGPQARKPGESKDDFMRRQAEEIRLRKLQAQGVDVPKEQLEATKLKAGEVGEKSTVPAEERISTNFPRLTSKTIEDAATAEINRDVTAKGQSFLRKDKDNPEEKVSGVRVQTDRPSFERFAKSMRGVTVDVKNEQLQEIWADKVWSNLLGASGERLGQLRKALGLEGRYGSRAMGEDPLGRRDIAPGEAPPDVTGEQAIRMRAVLEKRLSKLEEEATAKLKEADEFERNITEEDKKPKEGELFGATDKGQGLRQQAFELRYKAAQLRRSLDAAADTSRTLRRKADVRSMTQRGLSGIEADKVKSTGPLRPAERAGSMGMSQQAYRQKVVKAIAHQLIGEAYKHENRRANMERESITLDDLDFAGKKSKTGEANLGAYTEITPGDMEMRQSDQTIPFTLKKILRNKARARSTDPESATRRVLVVVGPENKVHLLSTYNNAGEQMVTDPSVRLADRPYRPITQEWLNKYHPIASLLLKDPVKGLRQEFYTVSDFRNEIGKEAEERSQVGDDLLELSHPEQAQFEAEGTRGLEGEMGSFQGPGRGAIDTTGRSPAFESEKPLGRNEAVSVAKYQTAESVRRAVAKMVRMVADKKKPTPAQMVELSAFRKISNKIEAGRKQDPELTSRPDLTDAQVVDRLADQIVQANDQGTPVGSLLREFGDKTPSRLSEKAATSQKELTKRGDIKPPTRQDVFAGPFQQKAAPTVELGADRPYIPEGMKLERPGEREAGIREERGFQLEEMRDKAYRNWIRTKRKTGKSVPIEEAMKNVSGMTPSDISELKSRGPMTKKPMSRAEFKEAKEKFVKWAKGPTLVKPEELVTDFNNPLPRFSPNIDQQLTRAYGFERIPVLGRLMGPRAGVRDPVDRSILGYAAKRTIGNSVAALNGARLQALSEKLGEPFKVAEDGKIENVKADAGQSTYPSDLFEDWQRQVVVPEKMQAAESIGPQGQINKIYPDSEIGEYTKRNPKTFELAPNQEKMFREFYRIIEDGHAYLNEKRAQVEAEKSDVADQMMMEGVPKGLEVYPFPRPARHRRGLPELIDEGVRRIGGKYEIDKDRLYPRESQGAESVVYEPDMVKRMVAFTARAYKAVADADLRNNPVFQGENTGPDRLKSLSLEYEADLRSGKKNQQSMEQMAYQPRLSTEGIVPGHPAFNDKIYPANIAKKLNKAFGPQPHHVIDSLAELSTASKALMLTGDVAQFLTQGAVMMARNPKAWGKAVASSLESIAKANVTGKYLENPDNWQAAQELSQHGVSIGHLQDFMSGSKPGELATTIPGVRQVVERSGRAFGTFFDIAKVELWKSLRDVTPKKEWPEMMEMVENMTLSGKMEASGLSGARSIVERLLFMAPSYYRAGMQLVSGLAAKGAAGNEVRKTLGAFAGGYVSLMVGAYLAAGMDWDEILERLTPGQRNSKFLSFPVKIGNTEQEIGLGNIVIDFISLGVDLGRAGRNDVKGIRGKETLNPLGGANNPLTRFVMNKLGPVPGALKELATGKDALGRQANLGTAVTRPILPVGLQSPVQRALGIAPPSKADIPAELVKSGSSFIGLRARTTSVLNDVTRKAQDFMSENKYKKETGWEMTQVDGPSYSSLRAAAMSGSQREFNKAYDALLETHTEMEIRDAMEAWSKRGFTGNKKHENEFMESLSDHDLDQYVKAREEKQKIWEDFVTMWADH